MVYKIGSNFQKISQIKHFGTTIDMHYLLQNCSAINQYFNKAYFFLCVISPESKIQNVIKLHENINIIQCLCLITLSIDFVASVSQILYKCGNIKFKITEL